MTRRGISTVIGGMMFVIVLSAGLAVLSIGLASQISTVETHNQVSDKRIKKLQEDFTVHASNSGDSVTIQVRNNGANPVIVKSAWIIASNDSLQNYHVKRIEFDSPDIIFNDGEFNMLDLNTASASSDTYTISGLESKFNRVSVKVVSELGNIQIAEFPVPTVSSVAAGSFNVSFLAVPHVLQTGNDGAMLLFVDNPTEETYEFKYKIRSLAVAAGSYPELTIPNTSLSNTHKIMYCGTTIQNSCTGNVHEVISLTDIVATSYCTLSGTQCKFTSSPETSAIIPVYFYGDSVSGTTERQYTVQLDYQATSLSDTKSEAKTINFCVYPSNKPEKC